MQMSHVTLMWMAAVMAAVSPVPAWAEADDATTQSDMHMMPGMDHSGMQHDMSGGSQASEGSDMSGMDHGAMQMQGGPVPEDARDPHAYSGGYTLDTGLYALPGPRQLRMGDEHNYAALLVDRLERVDTDDGNSTRYDAQAWYGRNYDRLVLKAEGDIADGDVEEADTELLWGHAIAIYWDAQLGARYDTGVGPNRSWLAMGVQGLAPYWFEVDATAYVGENGRTALGLEAEYELLFTQRLVLQPRVEANVYGKRDAERETGNGLSDAALGLRLRYEIRREFAPYVGVEWARKYGDTADYAEAAGEDASETRWVAGVRFWF